MTTEAPVAVVTGAGSGIGRATARRLSTEGWHVVCADVDAAGAAETESMLDRRGSAVQVDVADPDSVACLADLVRQLERCDALVACAGIIRRGSALDLDVASWDAVMAVNLRGPWLCATAVLPSMIAAGRGSIVNVASIAGLIGTPGTACYAASKAGLLGLTRQLAADYGCHGVRVNAVCPGSVSGGMAAAPSIANPLGRAGTPDEIAEVIAFLAGDGSSWVTGATYVVDGGRVAVTA